VHHAKHRLCGHGGKAEPLIQPDVFLPIGFQVAKRLVLIELITQAL
jgi:hypothetical protein